MSYLNTIRINRLDDKKANKKQEQWIEPTLLNGWENVEHWEKTGYMKDDFGFVHLKGRLIAGENERILILPSGYRPSKSTKINVARNSDTSIPLDINGSTGVVQFNRRVYQNYLSVGESVYLNAIFYSNE